MLAAYVFGVNVTAKNLTHDTFVTDSPSTQIKMTAPVNETTEGRFHAISFTMPKIYTLETLLVPLNDKIKVCLLGAWTH